MGDSCIYNWTEDYNCVYDRVTHCLTLSEVAVTVCVSLKEDLVTTVWEKKERERGGGRILRSWFPRSPPPSYLWQTPSPVWLILVTPCLPHICPIFSPWLLAPPPSLILKPPFSPFPHINAEGPFQLSFFFWFWYHHFGSPIWCLFIKYTSFKDYLMCIFILLY